MFAISWKIWLSGILIAISASIYSAYYVIFRDVQSMLTWMLMSMAFLPINILIVTLIVEGIISKRDKIALLNKLNMIIGAFFSEMGSELIRIIKVFDLEAGQLKDRMLLRDEWLKKDFSFAANLACRLDYNIDSRAGDLKGLQTFLSGKRGFLLRLLENQNLLEHESFTDLLWAVLHLSEELDSRNVNSLSAADHGHLSIDIKRAYALLLCQWLLYMCHLKDEYPYLYSLACRTNPFDPAASAEIKQQAP